MIICTKRASGALHGRNVDLGPKTGKSGGRTRRTGASFDTVLLQLSHVGDLHETTLGPAESQIHAAKPKRPRVPGAMPGQETVWHETSVLHGSGRKCQLMNMILKAVAGGAIGALIGGLMGYAGKCAGGG